MKLFSFASALAVLAVETFAMFEGVEKLTSANWADKVENDKDHAWMVTFYATWCPYCKTFDPELAAAMQDSRISDKKIRFGAVDVMANRDLTQKYGIKRSPTVKMFGHDKSAPEDYLGQRKHIDITDYAEAYANNHNFINKQTDAYIEEEIYDIGAQPDPYAEEYYSEPEPEEVYDIAAPEPFYDEPVAPTADAFYDEPVAPSGPSFGPATFYYNIGSIIGNIKELHQNRIYSAEAAHEDFLKNLALEYRGEVNTVKGQFDAQLDDLIADRSLAIQGIQDSVGGVAKQTRADHADLLASMNLEAEDIISQILGKNDEGLELSEFIPSLGKDWINIEWNESNRRQIPRPQEQTYGPGGYGGYVSPQQSSYRVPSAPSAPAAPAAPAPQSGYNGPYQQQQQQTGYNGGYGGQQQASYYGQQAGYNGQQAGYNGQQASYNGGYGGQQQQTGYGGQQQQTGYGGQQQQQQTGYGTGYGGQQQSYGGQYQQY